MQITAKLSKKQSKTVRFIIASAIGGFYSFIIFVDEMPFVVLTLTKIAVAIIIVLTSFKFYRVKSFVITLGLFLVSNFIMLGIIIGLYFLTDSKYIAVKNSVFYFDLSARVLLLCSFFAYLISCMVIKIYNRSLSKNEIYKIIVENESKSVVLFALADTGNKLYEPFSNSPVIIVDKKAVENIVGNSTIRIIPASTVNNSSFLQGFKPDRVIVKTADGDEVIENVYIAMSENMKKSSFSAVINPVILSA